MFSTFHQVVIFGARTIALKALPHRQCNVFSIRVCPCGILFPILKPTDSKRELYMDSAKEGAEEPDGHRMSPAYLAPDYPHPQDNSV